MWQEAPELVLKNIFSYLEASDLRAVFLTCRLWHRIATEDVIWKQLVQRLWKIKGSLPPGKISWRNEYQRLTHETPTHLSETLLEHSDEVLDVSFSHDGKLFCTTSKDATVKVWELGYPTKLKHNAKMLLLQGWNMTQFSIFNKSDTYLCVCGVQFEGNVEMYFPSTSGRAAVFRLNDFRLIQTMKMEPPQLFADWYDDTTVLGGYVVENQQNILHIKAFKVVEKEPFDVHEPDCGQIVYSFETNHHHTMNLLVADLPSCQHQSHDQSGDQHKTLKSQDPENQRNNNANSITSSDKHRKMLIFVCEQHSAFAVHDATDLHQRIHARNAKLQTNSKKLPSRAKFLKTASSRITRNSVGTSDRSNQGQLGRSSRGTQNASELPGASVLDKPTFRPLFDKYYISGVKLSPDQRELYFNYRIYHAEELDEEGYPVIDPDITIDKFNLVTKSHTKNLLRGHKASSSYPAWYICLDISQDYIVSGSEDGRAFLWDRNYLCFLGHLPHSENPEIVINGTAFCPTDSECVVTGGDDGVIHIWRSKRRLIELKRLQDLVPMDTNCTSCFP